MARAVVKLFEKWKLSDDAAREMLGGLAARTYARWKAGDMGRINRESCDASLARDGHSQRASMPLLRSRARLCLDRQAERCIRRSLAVGSHGAGRYLLACPRACLVGCRTWGIVVKESRWPEGGDQCPSHHLLAFHEPRPIWAITNPSNYLRASAHRVA